MLTFDPAQFETVTTKRQLAAWMARVDAARSFCVDTETTGLGVFDAQLVGIALSVVDGDDVPSCYIPLAHRKGRQLDTGTVLSALAPRLADRRKGKVLHNALYDMMILLQPRYDVRITNAHDTMLMAYALHGDQVPLGMDFLAERYFGWKTIAFKDVVSNRPGRDDFRDVPIDEATHYAAEDTAITLVLGHTLQVALKKEGRLWGVYTRDRQLLPVLADMKRTGVLVDTTKLARLEALWEKECSEIETRAHEIAGKTFALGSTNQLAECLIERGIEVPVNPKTGKYTLAKDALDDLPPDDLVDTVKDYRKKYKLLSTYARPIPTMIEKHSGRLHTNFPITRTSTGRFASNTPNLQNIPTRTRDGALLREVFVTKPGWCLLSADYSQIEYRVLAHITEAPYLLHCFRNGIDLHAKMAADVRGGSWQDYANKEDKTRYAVRSAFKNVNFAVIYGAGPAKVALMSNIEVSEAYAILDAHQDMAPEVYTWKEEMLEFARDNQYVETMFGRRIYLPNILSRNSERRGKAERLAINGIVQGSATGDLMRMALVNVYDGLQAVGCNFGRILLTVHDELVVECIEDASQHVKGVVVDRMQTAADHLVEWKIPIVAEADVGTNWRDAK